MKCNDSMAQTDYASRSDNITTLGNKPTLKSNRTRKKCICNGYFFISLIQNECRRISKGKTASTIAIFVEFTSREKGKLLLTIPYELKDDKNAVIALLRSGNMEFSSKDANSLFELFQKQVARASWRYTQAGFELIAPNQLVHSATDAIYSKAADSLDVMRLLGVSEDMTTSSIDRLLLYALNAAAGVITLIKQISDITLPVIVMVSPQDSVLCKLKEFMCAPESSIIPFNVKDISSKLCKVYDDIAITIPEKTSDYMMQQYLTKLDDMVTAQILSDSSMSCLPIFVSKTDKPFCDRDNDNIQFLLCKEKLPENGYGVRCWFISCLLKDFSLCCKLIWHFETNLNRNRRDGFMSEPRQNLNALIIAVANVMLSSLKINSSDHLPKLTQLLDSYNRLQGTDTVNEFVHCLLNNKDIPIADWSDIKDIPSSPIICVDRKINRNGCVYLFDETLADICKKLEIKPFSLKKKLNDANMLNNSNRLVTTVNVNDTTSSAISIKLNRLIPPGMIYLQTDKFHENRPQLMIPLGINNGTTTIYHAILPEKNAHCLVEGNSGSGKSVLLAQYARGAASQGCEVVFISSEDSVNTNLSDSEVFTDILLERPPETFTVSYIARKISGKLSETENRYVDKWLLGGKPKEFDHIEDCVDYMLQPLDESEETARIKTALEDAKTDGNVTGKICWNMTCASSLISRIAVPSDDIEKIDDIVRELYNYKLTNTDNHCIVILDEFQDMNMEEKAPIISLLMKKGRKLNISVVLATQFITAGIAQNIHSAVNLCPQKISFSPANRNNTITRMGLAEDERTLLSDLGVGECIAKGCDFATDKDFCRDAVKMKVFYKEQ